MKRIIEYVEPVNIHHTVEIELPDDNLDMIENIVEKTDFLSYYMEDILDVIQENDVKIISYKENIESDTTGEIEYFDDYDPDLK